MTLITPESAAREPTAPEVEHLRRLAPEDRDDVLELMRLALGEGPLGRTAEMWHWKHEANPFGPSAGLIAEAGGRLVGLRLFLRWRWRAGAAEIAAVRAVDTATHPGWRGRGIFRRLTLELLREMAEEGAGLVFNTPNSQSRPGYLKMGWRTVGRLRLEIRPVWGRLLRGLLGGRAAVDALGVADFGRPVQDLVEAAGLETWLGGVFAGEERLHTVRTASWLRWRYADVPGLGYRAVWDLDPDGAAGAAVVARARRRGGRVELSLAEVLVSPDRASRGRLQRLLAELVRDSGADYLLALAAARTPERRALRRGGFFPVVVPSRHFTVRPLAAMPAGLDPMRWDAWRLSLGDLELF